MLNKQQNISKNYQRETALRIPKIVEAQSRILVMEYVSGERLII